MPHYFAKAPATYRSTLCNRRLEIVKRASAKYDKATVAIGLTYKDQPETLPRALKSALAQTLVVCGKAQVIFLDDASAGAIPDEAQNLLADPSVTHLRAECGSPARARNLLLDWADKHPHIAWIARLDADDELATRESLASLVDAVNSDICVAAIGSNLLRLDGEICSDVNRADSNELRNFEKVLEKVRRFAHGIESRELPSCNLLLRENLGLRYPNLPSAEDHWLVASLLFRYASRTAIVADPFYCIYTLNGQHTRSSRANAEWRRQRVRLWSAMQVWLSARRSNRLILGAGLEGVVRSDGHEVTKTFYPWAMDDALVEELTARLANQCSALPNLSWRKEGGRWHCSYRETKLRTLGERLPENAIKEFLKSMYRSGLCAKNIKRDNLMLRENNQLVYIDIGKDIVNLSTHYFLDMCARLYSIGALGNSDEEFVRRKTYRDRVAALRELKGFERFYRNLIQELALPAVKGQSAKRKSGAKRNNEVTLLIKVCFQDHRGLGEQLAHIVTQLSHPQEFAEKVVLIDPHVGKFLRQHDTAEPDAVYTQVYEALEKGLVDRVLTAPSDSAVIASLYSNWFDQSGKSQPQTVNGAPLFPQLWGFGQLSTRYVLQCDCDVLIGRKCSDHDFLSDMLRAIEDTNVISVGFNIAHSGTVEKNYQGQPGEYAPEVRCGLLDLHRVRKRLPVENPLSDGTFTLTWHRALQKHCAVSGGRSLRGGNPKSFYVHPRNEHKDALRSSLARDLIAQGLVPKEQSGCFDWQPGDHWKYPTRHEPLVFLLMGRNTSTEQLRRCLNSLKHQVDQNFGIILIDDASEASNQWQLTFELSSFQTRFTLIRNTLRRGRIPNFLAALECVCPRSDGLICVLDQDDWLMHQNVSKSLLEARNRGHDLIQLPMFRPNKALKLYKPVYEDVRNKGGGDTWAHLRAFRRSLLARIPRSHLRRHNGSWFEFCTDYATMIPMAEMAESPVFLDEGYAYCHERHDYSDDEKTARQSAIREITAKPKSNSFVR